MVRAERSAWQPGTTQVIERRLLRPSHEVLSAIEGELRIDATVLGALARLEETAAPLDLDEIRRLCEACNGFVPHGRRTCPSCRHRNG